MCDSEDLSACCQSHTAAEHARTLQAHAPALLAMRQLSWLVPVRFDRATFHMMSIVKGITILSFSRPSVQA